ncbi:MAG: hypothetical protein HY701_03810 [Gemmatimonadetes bacterium]|nr:hypothetical protein [Gemmatimonadota bacterium]
MIRWVATGFVAWTVAVFVAWSGGLWLTPLDPEYTAGELLDHLMSWGESGILYPRLDTAPYRVLNYPPTFVALVALLAGLGIPPLAAGRVLNGVAILLLACVLLRDFRTRGATPREAAALTALLGTSFPALYAAGQFHLETLAVALTAAGFVALDRLSGAGRGDSPRAAALCGVLLALGCLVKQSQVPISLAGLIWAWRCRRSSAAQVTGAYALTGAVGSAAILAAFGPEAWRHMLTYSVGIYSLTNLAKQLASHALPWAGFASLGLWLGTRRGADRSDPRWWYFVASGLWSLSAIRVGSGYPYFLDWHVATLLWIGPWVAGYLRRPTAAPGRPGWALPVLALQAVGGALGIAAILGYHLTTVRNTAALLPDLCAEVAPAPALTPATSPGLVRACGGRPALHPFIMSSLARQGVWDPAPLVDELRAGRYPKVILSFDPSDEVRGVDAERWDPRFIESIRNTYVVKRVIGPWRVLEGGS